MILYPFVGVYAFPMGVIVDSSFLQLVFSFSFLGAFGLKFWQFREEYLMAPLFGRKSFLFCITIIELKEKSIIGFNQNVLVLNLSIHHSR